MKGHVRRRGNRWAGVIDTGYDAKGKRVQRWASGRTRKEVESKLAEIAVALERGTYAKPGKGTLGEYLTQWLDTYAASNVRARTGEGYKAIVTTHLIPQLGSIALAELRPSLVQDYYARALKRGRLDGKGGLSARTVLHHHRVLSEALGHAVKWGLVVRNVALAVDPPRPRRKEARILDAAGVRKLLDAAGATPYYYMFQLALYTGLRRSEFLGLRWQDIDLDTGKLSVVQVLHRLRDRRIVFEAPKTDKGRRAVALSPVAVLGLRAHRELQEAMFADMGKPLPVAGLVFCHLDGGPFLPGTVTHAFTRIARRVGLDGVRLHDLRHTHASLMLLQGVHPKIVQERLGHSAISITLDTYSHVMPGLQAAAANLFDDALAAPVPIGAP